MNFLSPFYTWRCESKCILLLLLLGFYPTLLLHCTFWPNNKPHMIWKVKILTSSWPNCVIRHWKSTVATKDTLNNKFFATHKISEHNRHFFSPVNIKQNTPDLYISDWINKSFLIPDFLRLSHLAQHLSCRILSRFLFTKQKKVSPCLHGIDGLAIPCGQISLPEGLAAGGMGVANLLKKLTSR